MCIENQKPDTFERILLAVMGGAMIALAFLFLSLFIFEVPSSETTYKVRQDIFTINRTFDQNSNTWLVGVMDADNLKLGSFVCASEPMNANPALYYNLTREDIFFGPSKYYFSFSYVENCKSVSASFSSDTTQMPNVQNRTPRQKGEFIL
jgi:hypothetical protein